MQQPDTDHAGAHRHTVPDDLKAPPQWVAWRRGEKRDGKWTKIPVNARTGRNASHNLPDTWSDFQTACRYADEHNLGIGFVFSADDPFCGIDLDKCRDPDTGTIEQWALDIIDGLDSYTEISPSGAGVHVIVRATKPGPRCKQGNIEMYDRQRFFTITGGDGTKAIEERQAAVDALYVETFGSPHETDTTTTAKSGNGHDLNDDEILVRAAAAANGDKFRRLFTGDARGYPSRSEAHLALIIMIAFWTGPDSARIERLFQRSRLWADSGRSEQKDYCARTIAKALSMVRETYAGRTHARTRQAAAVPPGANGAGDGADSGDAPIDDDEVEAQPEREAIQGEHIEHPTDTGNAHRFAIQHGGRLRYVDALGGWLVYDGRRWSRDDTGEVFRLWEQTGRHIYHEAALPTDRKERTQIAEWAKKSEARARVDAALALARHQLPIAARAADFDQHQWLLNLENGTYDLEADILRSHRKDDLITKLAPVSYDRAATAPKFHKMLKRILPSETIQFLQRFVGYSLTGSTTEQKLLLLYGTGANGKSTFIEIIRALLGDYAATADFSTFLAKERNPGGASPDVARLAGARFVSAIEMTQGGRLAEAVVKQVTGGDTLTARFLFHDDFSFRPAFKLVLVSNHHPTIRGTDYAIWRRVWMVPFEIIIPPDERDPHLLDHIVSTELPGVLNWALEGCRQWRAHSLGEPEKVKKATEEYRQEQDILGPFLAECCVVEPNASATAKDLYAAYTRWAEGAGEKKPFSKRVLGQMLHERGFRSQHTELGSCWHGLRVEG